MKFETASYAGKPGFNAVCPERGCKVKTFGTDKSKAKRAMQEHDYQVHKPVRDQKKADDRAARADRADERRAARKARKDGGVAVKSGGSWEVVTDPNDSRLNRKQKKKLLDQRKDEMKAKASSASEALRRRIDDTPVGRLPQINGLHTKGLSRWGIPDGQNINGIVYDKNGTPVPRDLMNKFIQGRE